VVSYVATTPAEEYAVFSDRLEEDGGGGGFL
jgi:hypothetical protein